MKMDMNKTNEIQSTAGNARKKMKNDIVFIVSLLILFSAAALTLFLLRTAGDTVVVTVNGQIFGEYSLSENRTVEITNGDGYNILMIRDGLASVERASCPDGICSSHRPIQHNGESIICLPNKVVVEVHAQNKNQPDIIS